MPVHGFLVDIFRKDISGVVSAGNLGEDEIPCTDTILYQQIRHRKVADFPKTPSPAYPDCGCCIRLDIQSNRDTQILSQRTKPQSISRTLHDTCELCLSRGQSYCGLSD